MRKNGTYGKMEPVLVQQIQTKTTSNRPTGAVQVQLVRFKGEQNCPAARFAKINPTLKAGVDNLVWLHRHPNVIRIRVFDKSTSTTDKLEMATQFFLFILKEIQPDEYRVRGRYSVRTLSLSWIVSDF